MICPVCYAHLRRSRVYGLRDRLIKLFTYYRPFACAHCAWRGLLSTASFQTREQLKQTILGWVLGIVLALGISWFLVGELQTQDISPAAASTEMKWFW